MNDKNKKAETLRKRLKRRRQGAVSQTLPTYDESLPRFASHLFATQGGIEELKNAKIIVASLENYSKPILLFGRSASKRCINGGESVLALMTHVSSFEELQFVLAAIVKFLGQPNTDGEEWRDRF